MMLRDRLPLPYVRLLWGLLEYLVGTVWRLVGSIHQQSAAGLSQTDRTHNSWPNLVSHRTHESHLDSAYETVRDVERNEISEPPLANLPHRELFHLVDLCLLRRTDEYGLHVLPYGIRQQIKDFLGALDNDSIRTAVGLWCENREAAIDRYGHISLWDTGRVTDMSQLFYEQSSFNDDISSWDVSKVTTMQSMVCDARAFNQPIGTWNTSNVTDMNCAFNGAVAFNQPLEDWDVSSVTTMMCMFCHAFAFNQSLSKWNASSVTDMAFMFCFTKEFNQPLNDWDVTRVATFSCMFAGTKAFNQPLDRWNLASATSISSMFWMTFAFNQPLVSWNVAAIPYKSAVVNDAAAFRQPETMELWRAAGYIDLRTMAIQS